MKDCVLIHNAKSGGGNELAALVEACKMHDLLPKVIAVSPRIKRDISRQLKLGQTLFIAAGGDGTVSAVAGSLVDTKASLGVIPVGTLNHFAKDMNIPVDVAEAVRTIAQGYGIRVDTATVNDIVFVNNSSIGFYSRLVKDRESKEHKIGKWPAAVIAGIKVFWSIKRFPVTIVTDDETEITRASFVFIGNNRYRTERSRLVGRQHLDKGRLSVYIVKTSRWGRMLDGVMRLMRGNNSRGAVVPRIMTTTVVLGLGNMKVDVAHDGEISSLRTPLRYNINPKSLQVIVPKKH